MGETFDNVKNVASAVTQDLRETDSTRTRVTVGGLAVTIIGKELGGSQLALGATLSTVYELTHNPFLAALAAAGVSLTMESGLSAGVARHLPEFSHTSKALEHIHANKPDWHEGHHHGRKMDRAIRMYNAAVMALTLGASGLVMDEFARNPAADREALTNRGMRIASRLAVLNFFGGLLLTGGIKAADALGHDKLVEHTLNILRNPLLYVGMVATGAAASGVRRSIRNRKIRRITNNPQLPQQRAEEQVPDTEKEE